MASPRPQDDEGERMYNGELMLLRLKSNGAWQIIGGMRATRLELNNNFIDASNVASGAWKEILSSGLRQVNISATGIFDNSLAEQLIRKLAFSGEVGEYQLTFANGECLEGRFFISHYVRYGDMDEEEGYSLSICSSGEVLFSSLTIS